MLDSKLTLLKRHFGIVAPADWGSVEPSWILAQDGIGPATLEYIRAQLCIRGLTLKNDQTPEYWRQHLGHVTAGGTVLGNEEFADDPELAKELDVGVLNPFVVFVDSAESQPFTFQGMKADASIHGDKAAGRPLIVPVESRSLGRHPQSLGDYTLDGYLGRCHIERKSMADAHSTILGFKDDHRARFESELENLNEIESSAVVVECPFELFIQQAPVWRVRTQQQNARTLFSSVISWQQKYPRVQWQFAGSRRMAEVFTFRWLATFWRHKQEERKAESRAMRPEKGKEKETLLELAGL